MNAKNIVFVHGFAASKKIWDFQENHFEAMGNNVYTVDLLGHGDGFKPNHVHEYRLDNLSHYFIDTIDKFNIKGKIIFVGHSLGAYVITNYLQKQAHRVEKLVLLSPLLSKEQLPNQIKSIIKHPKNTSTLLRILPLMVLYYMIRSDKINSNGLPEALLNQIARDYKRADPKIIYLLRDIPKQFRSEIALPTLLIFGQKDNIINQDVINKLSRNFPSSSCKQIQQGGHTIHHTHFGMVNEWISRYIQDNVI